MKMTTMMKKLGYLVSFIVAVFCVQRASAQTWTDTDLNGLWADTNNWTGGAIPPTTAGNITTINPVPGPTCTITNGEVESPGSLSDDISTYGSVFGPEFGAGLNIYGTLNFNWVIAPVQNNPTPADRSYINLFGGSALNGVNLGMGTEWWYWAAPYVTLNMYSNAQANVANIWFGGHLNIYDSAVLTATATIQDQGSLNAVTDAARDLNMAGGKLVLPTGLGGQLTNFVARGIILAYGELLNFNDAVTNAPIGRTNFDVGLLTITDNGTNTTVITAPLGSGPTSIAFQPLLRPVSTPGTFQQAVLVGNYYGGPALLSSADPGVNPAGLSNLVYSSSNPNVFTVSANGMITSVGAGTATLEAKWGALSSSIQVVVTPFSTVAKSLIHRYSFSETSGTNTADSVGGTNWTGTLVGGATFSGGQVVLDGSSGYVQLPAGIASNLNSVTLETWVTFIADPIATWAPVFAFGNTDTNTDANENLGENYIVFQPHTGGATAQQAFGQGAPGSAAETDAVGATPLDGLTNVQIVAVYNPDAGSFYYYTNGVLASSATIYNTLTEPASFNGPCNKGTALAYTLGADPLNYLGHSLYILDPYLNASFDEFRIYNGVLQPAQITADYLLGPNQLIGTNTSVRLNAAISGGNLVVTWPTNSALVNLVSSPVLEANALWTPVTGALTITGGNYQQIVPMSGGSGFLKLE